MLCDGFCPGYIDGTTVVPAEQMLLGCGRLPGRRLRPSWMPWRAENAQLRSAGRPEASDLRVEDIDSAIVDLRYATKNNLTGRAVYPAHALRRETARKLAAANAELIEQGYRIKLWDLPALSSACATLAGRRG